MKQDKLFFGLIGILIIGVVAMIGFAITSHTITIDPISFLWAFAGTFIGCLIVLIERRMFSYKAKQRIIVSSNVSQVKKVSITLIFRAFILRFFTHSYFSKK